MRQMMIIEKWHIIHENSYGAICIFLNDTEIGITQMALRNLADFKSQLIMNKRQKNTNQRIAGLNNVTVSSVGWHSVNCIPLEDARFLKGMKKNVVFPNEIRIDSFNDTIRVLEQMGKVKWSMRRFWNCGNIHNLISFEEAEDAVMFQLMKPAEIIFPDY